MRRTPRVLVHRPLTAFALIAVAAIGLAACASSAPEPATSAATVAAANRPDTSSAVVETTNANAADTTATPGPSTDDVFTAASATGDYPTFVKLIEQAGLAETLRTGGPFSIAIPSEEAFAELPTGTLSALEADNAELVRVLSYHVVPGLINADSAGSGPAPTLEGSTIELVFTKTSATINGAAILTAPRLTSNGAYVVIDKVLQPPKP